MARRILDREGIESLRKELGFSDPGIFEKSVYAFHLLSEVVQHYPGLVFKGGTSLLLHIFLAHINLEWIYAGIFDIVLLIWS